MQLAVQLAVQLPLMDEPQQLEFVCSHGRALVELDRILTLQYPDFKMKKVWLICCRSTYCESKA